MALICSHTAHTAYELQGEVPETIMTGQTADISNICEYDWYEWIMFLDNKASYPDEKQTLGRYLGPAIDVGSSMCYKILKANKEIVFRTTVRPLTLVELADPCHIKMRTDFNTQIADCLGAAPTMTNFDPSDLTPDCIYYEDDESSYQEGSPDEILPTPEGNDNYVSVEIMLPRGDGSTPYR